MDMVRSPLSVILGAAFWDFLDPKSEPGNLVWIIELISKIGKSIIRIMNVLLDGLVQTFHF